LNNRRRSGEEEEEEEDEEGIEQGGGDMQDDYEKRKVRQKLRCIKEKFDDYRNNDNDTKDAKFRELIDESREIISEVKGPSEAIEDAKIFAEICRIIREMSEDTSTNERKFIPSDFCTALARTYGAAQVGGDAYRFNRNNLIRLGEEAIVLMRRAPTFKFVLGTLNTEEKVGEVKERQRPAARRGRDKIAAPTKTAVIHQSQTTEAKTDNFVKQTRKYLEDAYAKNGQKPVCYFRFVINPDPDEGFCKTVENMFHVSFLVKQRIVKLAVGSNGLPNLEPLNQGDDDEDEEEIKSDQAVITICMADWEELKTNLKVKKPVIILKET